MAHNVEGAIELLRQSPTGSALLSDLTEVHAGAVGAVRAPRDLLNDDDPLRSAIVVLPDAEYYERFPNGSGGAYSPVDANVYIPERTALDPYYMLYTLAHEGAHHQDKLGHGLMEETAVTMGAALLGGIASLNPFALQNPIDGAASTMQQQRNESEVYAYRTAATVMHELGLPDPWVSDPDGTIWSDDRIREWLLASELYDADGPEAADATRAHVHVGG